MQKIIGINASYLKRGNRYSDIIEIKSFSSTKWRESHYMHTPMNHQSTLQNPTFMCVFQKRKRTGKLLFSSQKQTFRHGESFQHLHTNLLPVPFISPENSAILKENVHMFQDIIIVLQLRKETIPFAFALIPTQTVPSNSHLSLSLIFVGKSYSKHPLRAMSLTLKVCQQCHLRCESHITFKTS